MNVQLVVQNGNRGTKVLKLQCEETIIGRRQDCDLRIPSNDVSRRHCLLSVHDGCLNAEDLDSVNGTHINGKRITGRQIVMPGDRLQIGPVTFVAEYEMTQATLDRINGEAAEEASEVRPVRSRDTVRVDPTVKNDGAVDVLPLADEDLTELPKNGAPVDDDVIPPSAEFLEENNWEAPAESDLRALLSQMDEGGTKGKRKE